MKTLAVVLLLIATALLSATSLAAPKHAAKHAHPVDASKQVTEASPDEAPAPEADTSWKGKLGGAVIAMGGGALAAQLGLAPASLGAVGLLLSMALLVGLVVLLVRWRLRVRRGPAVYAGDYLNSIMPDRQLRIEPSIRPVTPQTAQRIAKAKASADAHGGFDVSKFLRSANTYFLRLQVAWDRGDLDDIREFTTPEILDEFKLQLEQRGDKPNRTGVDALDAELLKLETGDGKYVASVKFSGMIREENNQAERFVEVWSLSKPVSSSGGWTLAGIQQFS